MKKRVLTLRRWTLVLAAAALVLAGCQSPTSAKNGSGGTSGGNGSGNGTVPAGSLSANLSGAKSLVTTTTSASANFRGARAGEAASPLSKILEDGTPASVFTVPDGVTLPAIDFMAVHPTDGSVYISFANSFSLPDGTNLSFIRILPPPADGSSANSTIEIVEATATVKKFKTDGWKTKQPPVVFTSDGSIYYTLDTAKGTTLQRYYQGVSTSMVPDVKTDIKRFFSDGTNVYFLGKNNTGVIKSTYLRVFRPGAASADTVFETDTDGALGAWIKDVYVQNGSIVLSGYNIGDPDIATRRYDGILKLTYDATKAKWDWLHIYGSALDTANKNYTVNRRQLKAQYFKAADGTVSTDKIKAFAAPFFVGGVVPDSLDWFRIVDIDKVALDSTKVPSGVTVKLEHKFWYGLLSAYTGFDESYFYEVFLTKGQPDSTYYGTGVSNPIPEIMYPSSSNGVLLPTYVFDSLFGSDTTTFRQYSGTATALETALATDTTVAANLSGLKLKDATKAPLTVTFADVPDDMNAFLTWLDANFTYTVKGSSAFGSTKTWTAQGVGYPTTTYKVYQAMMNVYGTGKTGLQFKSRYLGTDGLPDKTALEALVQKFYPSATTKASAITSSLIAVPSGWVNSNTGKQTMLDTVFTLGNPRISATDSLSYPEVFYDYAKNQGLVTNPYLNLNLGTLFDTFNNLERFALDSKGSAFGLFRKPNGAGMKIVKLYDGSTGEFGKSITLDDLPALGAEFYNDQLYYVKKDGSSSYGIFRLAAFTDSPTPENLLATSAGLVIYDYRVRHVGTKDMVFFTAAESATGKTKLGILDTVSGSVTLKDLAGLDEGDQIEIYG